MSDADSLARRTAAFTFVLESLAIGAERRTKDACDARADRANRASRCSGRAYFERTGDHRHHIFGAQTIART